MSNFEQEEEEKSFNRVLDSFRQYSLCQLQWLKEKENTFMKLSDTSKRRLFPSDQVPNDLLTAQFQQLSQCIKDNQIFLDQLLLPHTQVFEQNDQEKAPKDTLAPSKITVFQSDIEKVKSTLRQIVREWSNDGMEERNQCFRPILTELNAQFPNSTNVRVLTPGCGLGRLTWEIANAGFHSQGNEYSFFMLICSYVIINQTSSVDQWKIYPWLHSFCNVLKLENQTRGCPFPDVLPANVPKGVEFSMCAGDFLEVYNEPESWDCVVTCFFLDTAHNIIEYVENIHSILKPGGVWINMGPLLYHWADSGEESVELNFDQLRNVITSFGMTIQKEETHECIYTGNYKSMMHLVYSCKFFVAIKAKQETISKSKKKK